MRKMKRTYLITILTNYEAWVPDSITKYWRGLYSWAGKFMEIAAKSIGGIVTGRSD
jgi:hypothetical protein